MTTPAQDAPLVFPEVAFRPLRLLVICLALTAAAIGATFLLDRPMIGVYLGVGMAIGLVNALLIRRSVNAITAGEHPLKRKMALNSATRLAAITVIALVIAYLTRPDGLGVVFGLALFQVLLVGGTALPVWKKIRTSADDAGPAGTTDGYTEGTA
ncbi:ATP synthase subunit I [Mycolicibacillus parakoreensis]|uniref:ATP synthase subunit I n=1 Tax=Mycolicibacillus parakoreensis TaxID=1069221 RepID=A0ABY3U148_9MYCO|nr:ATP synthase subunit I [Mycolicibacillus parakoreensis]MCV7314935.1 ATP synthase subunit I [Mycolicibacillus parakoreensis]ULN53690.1 ATP synthase subunit I [Mycolicibacillus parakoreensis]